MQLKSMGEGLLRQARLRCYDEITPKLTYVAICLQSPQELERHQNKFEKHANDEAKHSNSNKTAKITSVVKLTEEKIVNLRSVVSQPEQKLE